MQTLNQIRAFSGPMLRKLFVPAGLMLLCASLCYAQNDLANVIEDCERSVVRIETESAEGGGLGSGYLVSKDGKFVTNVHVLAGATKAIAILPTGQKFKITGTYHVDEARDICVGQMEAVNMVPIKFAAELPRKGEQVTALGSPLGLSFTATMGIVSAIREGADLGKEMGESSMKGTWIQVDAAISPGNSGGPLINRKGEVVAMSTLASSGGRAQNLNFGISIKDISAAVDNSTSARLKSLDDGVAKISSHETSGGAGGAESLIRHRDVPDSAIKAYVERGRQEFGTLSKKVRVQTTRTVSELKDFQKGSIGIPGGSTADIAVLQGRTRKSYYFRNESVKNRVVKRKEDRVRRLKSIKTELADGTPDQSLAAILLGFGPRIDIQDNGSVGFLDGAIVLHAFNDHEIAIIYNDRPYLMWVESTSGLSTAQELSPGVAFVAGTETMMIPGETSVSVTVLQEISDQKLERTFDDLLLYKEWKSGRFSIEAKLVKNDGTTVTLEKRDGSTIDVPISKLDPESAAYAEK